MKNLDRLLIVVAIFIVLACKCQSGLLGRKSSQTRPYPTPTKYDTPIDPHLSPTPNLSESGEYRQCSERTSLNYGQTGSAARLVINNNSQLTITVYRLGANNYESKYDTLTPGKSATFQSSLRGEWWMIADVSGNCQMIVSSPNTVNVK
jgi:hypothetical protein